MANFNKVILIGRLTRDPEVRAFGGGGKVAKFGFAVTNRKKNAQTGQWEDEPMFIDCEVFNRGDYGTLANLVEERCRKGSQVCLEGRLCLDQWEDKNGGGKRSKHKIIAESVQFLDRKEDGDDRPASGGGRSSAPASGSRRSAAPPTEEDAGNGDDSEIPF